jgi:hypothetical protein
MNRSTLNTRVLNKLASNAPVRKKPTTPGFARKRPVLSLTGDLAEAVRPASVGSKISFRVHGEVRAIPQRGQKPEVVIGVSKVTR